MGDVRAREYAEQLDSAEPGYIDVNEVLAPLARYLNTLPYGEQMKLVQQINKAEKTGTGPDLSYEINLDGSQEFSISFYESNIYEAVGWHTKKNIRLNSKVIDYNIDGTRTGDEHWKKIYFSQTFGAKTP